MTIIKNDIDFTYIRKAYVKEITNDADAYMSANAYKYFDFSNEFMDPDDIDDAFEDMFDDMFTSDEVCGNGNNGYRKIDAGRVASAFFQPELREIVFEQLGLEAIDYNSVFGGALRGYIGLDALIRSCIFCEMRDDLYDMFADLVRSAYENWKENTK